MRKMRSLGLALAIVGAYFALDPNARARLLLHEARGSWRWIALVLAGLLLLQIIDNKPSILLAASLVLLVIAGSTGSSFDLRTFAAKALPLLVSGIGVALVVRGGGGGERYVSVLWSRRLRAGRGTMQPQMKLVCVAGGMRFDLRSASLVGGERLSVRVFAGEIVVTIPREWRCELIGANLAWSILREEGVLPDSGPTLMLEVAAMAGVLVLRRI
jgi:hypothetical protein